MSPRCPRVCRRAAFSDGGADCGGTGSSGRPGGESGSSRVGPGGDGGGGEPGPRKGSGSSGRPGAGVNVETAVGEPGARGASTDLGGDGLNRSVQAGSASGSRAASSGGAPGTQSGWSREARPPLPPARSPLPPVRGPPAPPLPHPSPPTRLSGRRGGRPAAARGAPGPGGAAAAASAPVVAQQPHELADLRVEGPGRLTVRVADLVLEKLVAAAALRGRAPHLLAGQRGRHAAVGGQRLAAVQQQRSPHGRLQQRA